MHLASTLRICKMQIKLDDISIYLRVLISCTDALFNTLSPCLEENKAKHNLGRANNLTLSPKTLFHSFIISENSFPPLLPPVVYVYL